MLPLEQASFRAGLLESERHSDPRRLTRHGYKVFSQTDEDGMIAEIFRRIGTGTRTFVEIGVEHGIECNTAWLLVQGWSGLWIEADRRSCGRIERSHEHW